MLHFKNPAKSPFKSECLNRLLITYNLADRVYHYSIQQLFHTTKLKRLRVGNSEEPLRCDQFLKRNKKRLCVWEPEERAHGRTMCCNCEQHRVSVVSTLYLWRVYASLARRRELPKIAYTTHSEDKRQMFFL